MSKTHETITLRNIIKGPNNASMEKTKYEAYKRAILEVLPIEKTGILFRDLPDLVRGRLPKDSIDTMGSVPWHVTAVKVDLEARGLIERLPGVKPQRLRRVTP